MHAHDERDQFSPPSPPGRLRAVALAVVVHAALIAALTMGVNWTTTTDQPAVEAELWSAVPQQAAPALVAPPPPPAPPTPAEPPPPPAAVMPPSPPPPPRAQEKPDTREADIAIEREKKRLEQEKRERAEQQEREKRERERREKLEAEKKERLQKEKEREKERELKEKQEAQKRADQKKQAEEKRRAEEAEAKRKATAEAEAKRKAEADAKRRAEAQAAEIEKGRAEHIGRVLGMAGATGGENATGKDKVSSGPSGSYGGKVAAKVKPNIVYPDAISGNPRAVVEVRAAPDGTIVGKKLIQSSGNKAWDDAVLRALEKTETLPRDVDGRVPSSLEIGFRPQD